MGGVLNLRLVLCASCCVQLVSVLGDPLATVSLIRRRSKRKLPLQTIPFDGVGRGGGGGSCARSLNQCHLRVGKCEGVIPPCSRTEALIAAVGGRHANCRPNCLCNCCLRRHRTLRLLCLLQWRCMAGRVAAIRLSHLADYRREDVINVGCRP